MHLHSNRKTHHHLPPASWALHLREKESALVCDNSREFLTAWKADNGNVSRLGKSWQDAISLSLNDKAKGHSVKAIRACSSQCSLSEGSSSLSPFSFPSLHKVAFHHLLPLNLFLNSMRRKKKKTLGTKLKIFSIWTAGRAGEPMIVGHFRRHQVPQKETMVPLKWLNRERHNVWQERAGREKSVSQCNCHCSRGQSDPLALGRSSHPQRSEWLSDEGSCSVGACDELSQLEHSPIARDARLAGSGWSPLGKSAQQSGETWPSFCRWLFSQTSGREQRALSSPAAAWFHLLKWHYFRKQF